MAKYIISEPGRRIRVKDGSREDLASDIAQHLGVDFDGTPALYFEDVVWLSTGEPRTKELQNGTAMFVLRDRFVGPYVTGTCIFTGIITPEAKLLDVSNLLLASLEDRDERIFGSVASE